MFGIFFKDKDTSMIAPASTLVLFNKNIENFTHKPLTEPMFKILWIL
ncbi:hypothetical protein [Aggregatibacter sp. 2125159857]|nr:hypothetical protein [Aggregatibacter sp. 2125159857]QTO01083.1 hypothetical protein J5X96_07550 [Aggregatibacter sp. 2125159857]